MNILVLGGTRFFGKTLPFGEDGSTWACDTFRLERELGITPTPAATWMGELVRGPAVTRDAEDEARRAAELSALLARKERAWRRTTVRP